MYFFWVDWANNCEKNWLCSSVPRAQRTWVPDLGGGGSTGFLTATTEVSL